MKIKFIKDIGISMVDIDGVYSDVSVRRNTILENISTIDDNKQWVNIHFNNGDTYLDVPKNSYIKIIPPNGK
jgi:hypothetical protein